jgi:hypothetical protein
MYGMLGLFLIQIMPMWLHLIEQCPHVPYKCTVVAKGVPIKSFGCILNKVEIGTIWLYLIGI